ncbi:MAG: acyl carrier protein [Acidobacteria bacterium]|nr:MAG: acyl carrier protein [Acidobacteriota bacterium]
MTEIYPGAEDVDVQTIQAKIKQAISQVTGIKPEAIPDSASYAEDLGLDSLSILEITVSVESQFKFQATDEELAAIRTVEDTVNLVKKRLCVEVA